MTSERLKHSTLFHLLLPLSPIPPSNTCMQPPDASKGKQSSSCDSFIIGTMKIGDKIDLDINIYIQYKKETEIGM